MSEALAPESVQVEHQELKQFLARASREPGALGESARLVARLLDVHMEKEEQFALPALACLRPLAEGRFRREMADLLAQTEWLKKNLPDLLAEHRAILAALERLVAAARAAGRFDCVEFAEKLVDHARLEEEILYPAVIVLGEYIKRKLEDTVELNP
ncbi:MAG TPA: hemerythrin domain-containing protein [Burkholderiales bacterium]|nr:hemerythrin domain-containing protein [Burkholderiales bacterium]